MWDKQGVLRGECSCGDCEEFMTGCDVRCDYCDCVPTKHKRIQEDVESEKDYSKETFNTFPVPPVVIQANKLVFRESLVASSSGSGILRGGSDDCDTKPCLPFYYQLGNTPSDVSDSPDPSLLSLQYPKSSQDACNSSEQSEEATNLVATQIEETIPCATLKIKVENDSETSCYSFQDLSNKECLESVADAKKGSSNQRIPCVFCTKTFKLNNSRNRHMKSAHPDLVHVCPVCKKLFLVKTEYTDHMNSKHPHNFVVENNLTDTSISNADDGDMAELPLLGQKDERALLSNCSIKAEPVEDDSERIHLVSAGDLFKTEDTGSTVSIEQAISEITAPQIRVKLKDAKGKLGKSGRKAKKCVGRKLAGNNIIGNNATEVLSLKAETDPGIVLSTRVLSPSGEEKSGTQAKLKKGTTPRKSKTGDDGDITPVKCDFCDKLFLTKTQKKKHERAKHSPTEYHCQYCGKVYKKMYDLEDHERSHTGQRPFQCDICDKAFFSKHNLRCHRNLHSTRGAYVCMYCGKDFDSKGGMEYHELTHTGVRPQECKVCHKTFKHRSALITHERIHTGEKPYACKHCPKSFRDHSTLRKHERIHTLEKPYKCKECDAAYNQRWCLRTHYVKSHAGIPIPVYNPKYPMNCVRKIVQ